MKKIEKVISLLYDKNEYLSRLGVIFDTFSNFFKVEINMLQYERQQNIVDYLKASKSATVKELAKAVYVSEASVRRDLAILEKEGHIKRVYGGVMLASYANEVVPVELRDSANTKVKDEIAASAAKLINDGDTVFMDASTTVFRICKYIKSKSNLKIITNNIRVAQELKGTDIKVYCTGGEFFGKRDCFLGSFAESFIENVHADIMFFSSQGISEDGIISDVDERENALRAKMLKNADKKVFLCDYSKFGVVRPFILCGKDDIDEIICEKEIEFEK